MVSAWCKSRSRTALVMVLSPLKIVGHCLKALLEVMRMGATLVALADNLEQQVGSALIDRKITNLVQNEQLRGEITAQLAFEGSLRLGGTQGIDDVNGVSKQDAVALLASSVAQSGS